MVLFTVSTLSEDTLTACFVMAAESSFRMLRRGIDYFDFVCAVNLKDDLEIDLVEAAASFSLLCSRCLPCTCSLGWMSGLLSSDGRARWLLLQLCFASLNINESTWSIMRVLHAFINCCLAFDV